MLPNTLPLQGKMAGIPWKGWPPYFLCLLIHAVNMKNSYLHSAMAQVWAAQAITHWFPVFHWKKHGPVIQMNNLQRTWPCSEATVLMSLPSLFSYIFLNHVLDCKYPK